MSCRGNLFGGNKYSPSCKTELEYGGRFGINLQERLNGMGDVVEVEHNILTKKTHVNLIQIQCTDIFLMLN